MKISLVFLATLGLLSIAKAQPASPNAPTTNVAQSVSVSNTAPTTVVILLYPGVELLDFAGPLEVFSAMQNSRVVTVAAKPGPLVVMKNALTVIPDFTIETCPQPDVLVVPGASSEAIQQVMSDSSVINWIRRTRPKRELTMSVCTGTYVLAQAGELHGKTVTTHWSSTKMLRAMYADVQVKDGTRFVEDGNLLTTAGVSAGIDGALHVVAKLRGTQAARAVAELMEYDYWNPKTGLVMGQQPAKVSSAKTAKLARKVIVAKATLPAKPGPILNALTADGIDPVCGMTVPKGTTNSAMFGGKKYGFCSDMCRERFQQNPTKYVQK